MKTVNIEELHKIQGGFSASVGLAVAAVVIFLSGIIDGIVHPKSCEQKGDS